MSNQGVPFSVSEFLAVLGIVVGCTSPLLPIFYTRTTDVAEITALPDFFHKKECPPGSFLRLEDVFQYFKDYIDHFHLQTNIQVLVKTFKFIIIITYAFTNFK